MTSTGFVFDYTALIYFEYKRIPFRFLEEILFPQNRDVKRQQRSSPHRNLNIQINFS